MKISKEPTHMIVRFPDYETLTPEQKKAFNETICKIYERLLSTPQDKGQQDIENIPFTKKSKLDHISIMAGELGVKVPKSIYNLPFMDIWRIEWELECEMSDRETFRKYNTIVSYDPPKPSIEERIAKRIATARLRKSGETYDFRRKDLGLSKNQNA